MLYLTRFSDKTNRIWSNCILNLDHVAIILFKSILSTVVFVHNLLVLEFFQRGYVILAAFALSRLGRSLGKIPTKKSKNIQDSYQGFQEFLHWVYTWYKIVNGQMIIIDDYLPIAQTFRPSD